MLDFLASLALCIFIGAIILWIIAGFRIAAHRTRQRLLSELRPGLQQIPWGNAALFACFWTAILVGALALH